jgi:hypothetical protein
MKWGEISSFGLFANNVKDCRSLTKIKQDSKLTGV